MCVPCRSCLNCNLVMGCYVGLWFSAIAGGILFVLHVSKSFDDVD